jgi:formyl-CoA transferase
MTSRLPLARFKVLDLTAHRAGPTAVRQLADWGAQVTKIEAPDSVGNDIVGADRHNPDAQNLHRNKRSMTLNLKTGEGRDIFFRMAATADVVVENYRSSVKKRLGIDYEAVAAVNPRIVYGSISGFGQEGPYADRPGVDQIAQGMGGLMSITGLPDQGPMRVGIPIADLTSGHFLAQGILMALLDREVTGQGQCVTTSLLEAQVFMLDFQAARWLVAGEVPVQAGNDHPTGIPTGVFPTKDGQINIAAPGKRIWTKLCEVLGDPGLLGDPDFADAAARSANRKALNARIAARTSTQPSAHWIDRMNAAGIPCGPINRIDQVFADPQVRHAGIATPVDHPVLGSIELVGQPFQLSRAGRPPMAAAPEPAEHTDQILAELGLGGEEIARLRERQVV